MRIRRRNLRKGLIALGCLVGQVAAPAALGGALLLVLGAGLHLWSKGCLEQNRRLTTAGPYRWTRNPFYLANALIDLGLCLVIGRLWVVALFAPIWLFSYRGTIEREEARLAELFPDAMPAYVQSVPRLLPTGRRLPRARVCGRFSLDNPALSRGREYARLLGIALAPGVIWAAERLRSEGLSVFDAQHGALLGLIALLLVAWVIKLALAETFRRPETQLLPFASRSGMRAGLAWGGIAGTLWLSGALNVTPTVSLAALVTLGWATTSRSGRRARAALSAHSGRRAQFGLRALVGSLGLALLVIATLESGRLWAAALPLGWCGLQALDELGQARAAPDAAASRPRWKFLPAIALGAVATVALIVLGVRSQAGDASTGDPVGAVGVVGVGRLPVEGGT